MWISEEGQSRQKVEQVQRPRGRNVAVVFGDSKDPSVPGTERPRGKVARDDYCLEGQELLKHTYTPRSHPRSIETEAVGMGLRHQHC